MSNFQIDLEELTQKCMGNTDLVGKLVIRFQASLPQLIDEIVHAANQNDMAEVRNIAHRLKGEAGTMCARETSSLAGRIMETASPSRKKELALLITELVCSGSTSPIQERASVAVESH